MASEHIRREIWKKGVNELFCNRDFLVHGSRALVDTVLSELAKKGFIIRLARGVYCRQLGQVELPSVEDIVKFKAAAFFRTVKQTIAGAAARLGLIETEHKEPNTFITDGSSSSFAIYGELGVTRVYFKKATARKMMMADDLIDSTIKVLWSLKEPLDKGKLHQVLRKMRLTKDDEQTLRRRAKVMPAWVADVVTRVVPRFRL